MTTWSCFPICIKQTVLHSFLTHSDLKCTWFSQVKISLKAESKLLKTQKTISLRDAKLMLAQNLPSRRHSLKKWRINRTHFIMRVSSTLDRPNSNVETSKGQLEFLNNSHVRSRSSSTLSKAVTEDFFSTKPFANFKWVDTKSAVGPVTLTFAH